MKSIEQHHSEPGLEYASEFKELIRQHPGAIATFRKLETEAREKLKTEGVWDYVFEENGVNLKLLDSLGSYFKVEMDGHAFFVKRTKGFYEAIGVKSEGVDEYRSAQEAQHALEGIKNVEVIDFQLGYQDGKGGTYFVSKWLDYPKLNRYLATLTSKEDLELKTRLEQRIRNIITHLQQKWFVDAWDQNMLYDPLTDKIIVFDVHQITNS